MSAMKKLINSPERVLSESLEGFAAAHAGIIELGPERKFVRRRALTPTKVALVSLVGSFVTSLEMAGCSITLSLLGAEMTALWDHPVRTAALRW